MRLLPNVIKASQYACITGAVTIIPASPGCRKEAAESEAVEKRKQILDETAEEAKKILNAAQLYGEKLIQDKEQQLKEESTKIRARCEKEGYQKGFEQGSSEGYEAGYQQGKKEAANSQQQVLDDMQSLLEDMETQEEEILKRFSSDIQKLSFEIAKKIIHTEIQTNELAMASLIENATEAYRSQAFIKLTIPKSLENWVSKDGSLIIEALHKVSENVKAVASSNMEEGGCLIDMPEQLIDAGVETQLSRVKAALQL